MRRIMNKNKLILSKLTTLKDKYKHYAFPYAKEDLIIIESKIYELMDFKISIYFVGFLFTKIEELGFDQVLSKIKNKHPLYVYRKYF